METSYELEVVDVVEETADAHSITFAVPPDAAEAFAYTPGQFLTLAVPSDQTGVAARCYSLCSSPADADGRLTVTVKRTDDGYASNWICDNLRDGDTIRVLPPSGIFTPKSLDVDLLLFAGGSGITPIMSITRTALAHGRGRVVLFYANRDERSVIFAQALTELAAEHPDRLQVVHWLESVQGLPTAEQLRAFAAGRETWDAFVCGPAPFMKLVVGALKELEFPRERRHQEKFVSLGGNPFGDEAGAAKAAEEVAAAESDDEPDRPAGPRRGTRGAVRAGGEPGGGAGRREAHLRRLGPVGADAPVPGEQGGQGAVLVPRGGVLGVRRTAAGGLRADGPQRRPRRGGSRGRDPARLPVHAHLGDRAGDVLVTVLHLDHRHREPLAV